MDADFPLIPRGIPLLYDMPHIDGALGTLLYGIYIDVLVPPMLWDYIDGIAAGYGGLSNIGTLVVPSILMDPPSGGVGNMGGIMINGGALKPFACAVLLVVP